MRLELSVTWLISGNKGRRKLAVPTLGVWWTNIWWPAKVCTVETSKTSHHRLYSQNPKSKYSWCSLLKAKLENTSFMLFFCSKSRCWLLLELVLGIFLASIPALVSSSLFCHVNNAKTDKTSFDIPKMCPTGFKTFNGSKSIDVKWYAFLNIFSICICLQIV